MELGERLRLARQEAGFSQRQLCADIITRNMLSQIEHGTAKPSMETLRCLAARLGKPVSYFLEEDVVLSPNQDLMARARLAWEEGNAEQTRVLLQAFQHPDPVLQWQWQYLFCASTLAVAEILLGEGKDRYARQLLEEDAQTGHGIPGLERQRLLLLARIPGTDRQEILRQLPSMDEELLLRSEAALEAKEGERAAHLLLAAQNRENPSWYVSYGRALMLQGKYAEAAQALEKAEAVHPRQCYPLLEECFRELGDFQKAYEYACRQR